MLSQNWQKILLILILIFTWFLPVIFQTNLVQAQSCINNQAQCCYSIKEVYVYENDCKTYCSTADKLNGCIQCETIETCDNWGVGGCESIYGQCTITCAAANPYAYQTFGTRGSCYQPVATQPPSSDEPDPNTPQAEPLPDCGWCEGRNNCPGTSSFAT